jgi:hypothetical protein
MDLSQAIREALENQVLEHEPGQAALIIRDAVAQEGAEAVASGLVDAAAVALRRMVAETDAAYDQAELLERLAFDGVVAADSLDLLGGFLVLAAATAGGVRPSVDPIVAEVGAERALFGAWLAALTAIRIVAISLERTEADVADDVVTALGDI